MILSSLALIECGPVKIVQAIEGVGGRPARGTLAIPTQHPAHQFCRESMQWSDQQTEAPLPLRFPITQRSMAVNKFECTLYPSPQPPQLRRIADRVFPSRHGKGSLNDLVGHL